METYKSIRTQVIEAMLAESTQIQVTLEVSISINESMSFLLTSPADEAQRINRQKEVQSAKAKLAQQDRVVDILKRKLDDSVKEDAKHDTNLHPTNGKNTSA